MAIDWDNFINQGLGAVTARVVKEVEGEEEVVAPAAEPAQVAQVIDRTGGVKTIPTGTAQAVGFSFAGINKPLIYGSVGLLAVALIIKAVK